jgi:hypothetical protein
VFAFDVDAFDAPAAGRDKPWPVGAGRCVAQVDIRELALIGLQLRTIAPDGFRSTASDQCR